MSDRHLLPLLSLSPLAHRTKNKKKIKKDDASFEEGPYDPVRGEVAMWQAVLTQALMDAASGSAKPEAQQEKADALRWLKGDSADFVAVCLNAGLDPAYARCKIRLALARNCRWRADTRPSERPCDVSSELQHRDGEQTQIQPERKNRQSLKEKHGRKLGEPRKLSLIHRPVSVWRELPGLASCWGRERLVATELESC
jgi:hypothetical protein